jgi:hypothetical protein
VHLFSRGSAVSSNVSNATAKILVERVERLLDFFDEMLALRSRT